MDVTHHLYRERLRVVLKGSRGSRRELPQTLLHLLQKLLSPRLILMLWRSSAARCSIRGNLLRRKRETSWHTRTNHSWLGLLFRCTFLQKRFRQIHSILCDLRPSQRALLVLVHPRRSIEQLPSIASSHTATIRLLLLRLALIILCYRTNTTAAKSPLPTASGSTDPLGVAPKSSFVVPSSGSRSMTGRLCPSSSAVACVWLLSHPFCCSDAGVQ